MTPLVREHVLNIHVSIVISWHIISVARSGNHVGKDLANLERLAKFIVWNVKKNQWIVWIWETSSLNCNE